MSVSLFQKQSLPHVLTECQATLETESVFPYLDVKNRDDRDQVLAAIERSRGAALEFASPRLQGDRDIVSLAVSLYVRALKFASSELKDDNDLILGVVSRYGNALEFASPRLQADRETVLKAIERSRGSALQFASSELKEDKVIVLAAIQLDFAAFEFAGPNLKADKNMVLAARKRKCEARNRIFRASKYPLCQRSCRF